MAVGAVVETGQVSYQFREGRVRTRFGRTGASRAVHWIGTPRNGNQPSLLGGLSRRGQAKAAIGSTGSGMDEGRRLPPSHRAINLAGLEESDGLAYGGGKLPDGAYRLRRAPTTSAREMRVRRWPPSIDADQNMYTRGKRHTTGVFSSRPAK